jgi:hypothetical protein
MNNPARSLLISKRRFLVSDPRVPGKGEFLVWLLSTGAQIRTYRLATWFLYANFRKDRAEVSSLKKHGSARKAVAPNRSKPAQDGVAFEVPIVGRWVIQSVMQAATFLSAEC